MVGTLARSPDYEPAPAAQHFGFPVPGPQSPTAADVLDDVFFLTESQWRNACAGKEYDYVIIGTGFCALAAATRLLELQPTAKLLLLERGTFFLPAHFQAQPAVFQSTLGGQSETFPWTVDRRTFQAEDGDARGSHGSVPFFGGRSTVWSAWCPVPREPELRGWPPELVTAVLDATRIQWAKDLLRVQPTDAIPILPPEAAACTTAKGRPLYGPMQASLQKVLQSALDGSNGLLRGGHGAGDASWGIDRVEAAPLASSDRNVSGIDFLKYSVPGPLLKLKQKHPAQLDIVLNCTVRRIIHQGNPQAADAVERCWATALETSRGVLSLAPKCDVILAMGALPPATLAHNSFRHLQPPALDRFPFSGHFISSIVARVPRMALGVDSDSYPQVGAMYISGGALMPANGNNGSIDFDHQFHIQLSAIYGGKEPDQHAAELLRYMPDVVATASRAQLASSPEHVVLVCAVLGELDIDGGSYFKSNLDDHEVTTNSLLRVVTKGHADRNTWSAMDAATHATLLKIAGSNNLQYWTKDGWSNELPKPSDTHVPLLVHESSTLRISDNEESLVGPDYLLRGTGNVYVTGAALWPRGGSWNPTLTMVSLAAHLAEKLAPRHQ